MSTITGAVGSKVCVDSSASGIFKGQSRRHLYVKQEACHFSSNNILGINFAFKLLENNYSRRIYEIST